MEWEKDHRGCIYGRVARDGGRTWLQYWFWLYYNPKHLFGFGKHEGDWEMIQIGLGEDVKPEVASFAQHNSGEARPWKKGAMDFAEDDPNRPVVYVAPFSHASYFKAGSQPYVLGLDDPRGDGPPADLPLAELRRLGLLARQVGKPGAVVRRTDRAGAVEPRPPGGQVECPRGLAPDPPLPQAARAARAGSPPARLPHLSPRAGRAERPRRQQPRKGRMGAGSAAARAAPVRDAPPGSPRARHEADPRRGAGRGRPRCGCRTAARRPR